MTGERPDPGEGAPSGFRRVYGAGPWHLIVTVACLTLVGLSVAAWLDRARPSTAASSGGGGAMAGMDMASPGAGPTAVRRAGNCSAHACPIPSPATNELAVAGQLGSALAALWLEPAGRELHARLELLTANIGPVRNVPAIAGASAMRRCGPGCWTFTLPRRTAAVRVSARQRGRRYVVDLPTAWQQDRGRAARRILQRSVAIMRALRGVRISETLTAGPPGPVERIHYRFSAPDRMAYIANLGARNVTIGGTTWSYAPGQGWQRGSYGSGAFRTRSWYDWTRYDQSIQLLDEAGASGRSTADIALMDPRLPVWFRLHVDLSTGRVGTVSMIAGGHFMTDRYHDFGVPQRIAAPPS